MRAKGFLMEGLAATADQTQMHVVSDEGNHLGPVELMLDVLDRLGDTNVSSQATVMMGAKDIQSDVLIVGDIEQPLVVKEVSIL